MIALIRSGLSHHVTEGLHEPGNNGDIVFGQVAQLDGLNNMVVVLCMLGSTQKNFLVVLVGIGKVEKTRILFNDPGLE